MCIGYDSALACVNYSSFIRYITDEKQLLYGFANCYFSYLTNLFYIRYYSSTFYFNYSTFIRYNPSFIFNYPTFIHNSSTFVLYNPTFYFNYSTFIHNSSTFICGMGKLIVLLFVIQLESLIYISLLTKSAQLYQSPLND
jgi:hypothetical protein